MTKSIDIINANPGRNVSFAFSVYIIVIVLTLALSIVIVGYFSVKKTILNNNDDLVSLEIRTLENFLGSYFANHLVVLKDHAESPIIIGASMHNIIDDQYPLLLKDKLHEFRVIGKSASFALLDIDGSIIETNTNKSDFSELNLPVIEAILNEELDYFIEFYRREDKGLVIRYIVPVLYNSLPEGILVADVFFDLTKVIFHDAKSSEINVSIVQNGQTLYLNEAVGLKGYIEQTFDLKNSNASFLFRVDVSGYKAGLYALIIKVLVLTTFIMLVFLVLFRFMGEKLFVEPSQIIRRSQKETELVNQKLLSVNEDLSQFAYIASHDLKSPLLAVTQLAGWIKDDCEAVLPEGSKRHLVLMQERISRMQKLLDDLLEYSRVGRYDYEFERVDVKKMGSMVFDLHKKSSAFSYSSEGDCGVWLMPRTPVEIVLRNLFSNSVKHHDKGHGEIKLICSKNAEYYILSVMDDGPGIDESLHSKAFEMFQTLKPRDEVEGSGMGLALVKKIVGAYGGKVEIHSSVGRGTTITTYWPIPKVKA